MVQTAMRLHVASKDSDTFMNLLSFFLNNSGFDFDMDCVPFLVIGVDNKTNHTTFLKTQ